MEWYELVAYVIVVGLGIVGTFLCRYIAKKGASDKLVSIVDEGWSLLEACVASTTQSFVSIAKEANGGKLTDAQAEQARTLSITNFMTLANDEVKLVIENVYGSLDDWLAIAIEAIIAKDK